MNRYKTLLTLTLGLSGLTGCMPLDSKQESPQAQHEKCKTDHYLIKTHLPTSKRGLRHINIEQASHALTEHTPLIRYIMQRCEAEGIPNDIAFIPVLSSQLNPQLEDNGNAGIWQLNPVMAQNLSLENNYWFDARKDIVSSTEAVLSYIKFLHHKLEQDWSLAITAYYIGLQPVLDALNYNKSQGLSTKLEDLKLSDSEKQHIEKLQAVFYLASHIDISSSKNLHIVSLPGQIELDKFAQLANINPERLHYLNAGFRRPLTDINGNYQLLIDEDDYKKALSITKNIEKLRQVSKSNWNHHIVKQNENLSLIAHNFDISVNELKRVNHLHSDTIQVDQHLIIPDRTSLPAPPKVISNNHPGPKRILHTVTSSDTLYYISIKYHVSPNDITTWNNLKGNRIHPEQTLTIWQYTPTDTARFYTVKPNDSLAQIARMHKTSIQDLKEANQLKNDIIHPKQRLLIPSK